MKTVNDLYITRWRYVFYFSSFPLQGTCTCIKNIGLAYNGLIAEKKSRKLAHADM